MSGPALKPVVFFDRDGIVNRSPGPGYVERWADFHLLPEFVAALRIVTERGWEAVIITNQRGVGRGIMSQASLDEIHANLRSALTAHGLSLRDIRVCTATDDADPRRKPNPGMILEAARLHGLDLARAWMIGDSEKDVQAGRRAGCRTIRVAPAGTRTEADVLVQDMASVAAYLGKNL